MSLAQTPIPPIEDWQVTAARAAIATQPDRDRLADMLGLPATPPADPEPRRRALPRHGGGRKAVQA